MEAVSILKEGVEKNPDSYQLLADLAVIQKRNGSLAECKTTLEAAISKYEREVKFLSELSDQDFEQGTYDLRFRLFVAVNCTPFFASCIEAADEDFEGEVIRRIRKAHESIGGDPSILTEPQAAEASQFQQILDQYELPGNDTAN